MIVVIFWATPFIFFCLMFSWLNKQTKRCPASKATKLETLATQLDSSGPIFQKWPIHVALLVWHIIVLVDRQANATYVGKMCSYQVGNGFSQKQNSWILSPAQQVSDTVALSKSLTSPYFSFPICQLDIMMLKLLTGVSYTFGLKCRLP